jgi:hypothetical protein
MNLTLNLDNTRHPADRSHAVTQNDKPTPVFQCCLPKEPRLQLPGIDDRLTAIGLMRVPNRGGATSLLESALQTYSEDPAVPSEAAVSNLRLDCIAIVTQLARDGPPEAKQQLAISLGLLEAYPYALTPSIEHEVQRQATLWAENMLQPSASDTAFSPTLMLCAVCTTLKVQIRLTSDDTHGYDVIFSTLDPSEKDILSRTLHIAWFEMKDEVRMYAFL